MLFNFMVDFKSKIHFNKKKLENENYQILSFVDNGEELFFKLNKNSNLFFENKLSTIEKNDFCEVVYELVKDKMTNQREYILKEIKILEKNKKPNSKVKFNINADELLREENVNYLKIYLVILKKGFSWQKEIETSFNIESSSIKKGIKFLSEIGFIISNEFYDIELEKQELIKKLNGAYFNKINSFPKIYIISKSGIEFFKTYEKEIKETINLNESLKFTYDLIEKKTIATQKIGEDINYRNEDKDYISKIDESTGNLFYYKSEKLKNKQEEIKEIVFKLKNQKNQKKEIGFVNNFLEVQKREMIELRNKRNELNYNSKIIFDKTQILEKREEENEEEKGNINFNLKSKQKELKKQKPYDVFLEERDEDFKKNQEIFKKLEINPNKILTQKENSLFEELVEKIRIAKKISFFKIEENLNSKQLFENFKVFVEDRNNIICDKNFEMFIYNFDIIE
jgi:hypothetical protein